MKRKSVTHKVFLIVVCWLVCYNSIMGQDVTFRANASGNQRASGKTSRKIPKKNMHIIFIDPLQLIFKQLTLGYEWIDKEQKYGVNIPFTFGFSGPKKFFEMASGIKFYLTRSDTSFYTLGGLPMGEGFTRYFLGPTVYMTMRKEGPISVLALNNGISLQLLQGIHLSATFGIGPAFYWSKPPNGQSSYFTFWGINTSVGWKFSSSKVQRKR